MIRVDAKPTSCASRVASIIVLAVFLFGCAIERGRPISQDAFVSFTEGKTTSDEIAALMGRPTSRGLDGAYQTWLYSYGRADYAARALTFGIFNQKTTSQVARFTFDAQGVLLHKRLEGGVDYSGGLLPRPSNDDSAPAKSPTSGSPLGVTSNVPANQGDRNMPTTAIASETTRGGSTPTFDGAQHFTGAGDVVQAAQRTAQAQGCEPQGAAKPTMAIDDKQYFSVSCTNRGPTTVVCAKGSCR